MKAAWPAKTVGDVCHIVGGGTPSRLNETFFNGSIPWATVRDMKADWIESTEFLISQDAVRKSATNVLPAGTVVVASRVGLGKVCRVRRDTAINQDLRGFLPREAEQLDEQYLFYWFKSVAHRIVSAGTGATVQGVTLPFLRSLKIPVPPLEKQRRIVAVLDEAFAAIAIAVANAEKNLANARELFSSYLERKFNLAKAGARLRYLEELCVANRVITYGVIKLGEHVANGVPCLRTSNVRWLDLDLDGMKCIDPGLSTEYRRTILRGGEVLVNVRGTLGGVAVVDSSMAGWNVSREVAVVPCDTSRVDPRYLAYWVGTPESQEWLAGVEKGVAYTGINISDLRSLPVPELPMDTQHQIVSDLDTCLGWSRNLEVMLRKKIEAFASLKQALLRGAFSRSHGSLDPLAA